MWIKRADWVKLLTEATENRVMSQTRLSQLDSKSDALVKSELTNYDLVKRVKELESRILEMQDELNQARRAALKPGPVMLDDSLFDEVDEDVQKMRREIAEDGADAVLARNAVDSGVGEL